MKNLITTLTITLAAISMVACNGNKSNQSNKAPQNSVQAEDTSPEGKIKSLNKKLATEQEELKELNYEASNHSAVVLEVENAYKKVEAEFQAMALKNDMMNKGHKFENSLEIRKSTAVLERSRDAAKTDLEDAQEIQNEINAKLNSKISDISNTRNNIEKIEVTIDIAQLKETLASMPGNLTSEVQKNIERKEVKYMELSAKIAKHEGYL